MQGGEIAAFDLRFHFVLLFRFPFPLSVARIVTVRDIPKGIYPHGDAFGDGLSSR
jgi:hypothetical protein